MNKDIHINETKGTVTMPIEQFTAMQAALEKAEDDADDRAFNEARARQEVSFPLSVWEALEAGESPLRVFREYHKFTQEELAARAEVSRVMIARIEGSKGAGSVSCIKRLAATLGVPMDLLVPDEPVIKVVKSTPKATAFGIKKVEQPATPKRGKLARFAASGEVVKAPRKAARKVAKTKK